MKQNNIVVLMIPAFGSDGNLPFGIHKAGWGEFVRRFGGTSARKRLLAGLRSGLENLRGAGCHTVYVDGSFVTDKEGTLGIAPGDFDACWDTDGVDENLLDPILLTFENKRAAQKAKYLGEFFPMDWPANLAGDTFRDFFQTDKQTGESKGIVQIDLNDL